MSTSNKKVLIITYYWPPSGGAGVQRWLKLSKYLPEFGVEPIILTVDEEHASYPQVDASLLSDIHPDLQVRKTKSFEILNWYKKLRKTSKVPYGGFANQAENISLSEKIMRFIRGNFFIPDARKGWNKYAIKEAVKIISSEDIQTIITTGPPHSTHLIGLKLKRNYPQINWLADFRDPWTDIFYNDLLMQTGIAKKLNIRMERRVLEKADSIATVGENLKKILVEKSKLAISEKIFILPNGFDPADFKSLEEKSSSNIFKIIYLGTASKDYPFQNILEAIHLLEEKEKANIQFETIGSFDYETDLLFKKYESSFTIIKKPYISHDEVPDKLNSADLLVLMIPKTKNDKLIITGKIFEYLAVRKTILGIGPVDGDASKIVQETDAGEFFQANDIASIKGFIRENLKENTATFKGIEKYSRKKQAEKLGGLLKTLQQAVPRDEISR